MPNTGNCIVQCKSCDKGCSVNTSINRNKAREENVVSTTCEHFGMRISIYTNSNYLSWIVGEKDKISFYMFARCANCNRSLSNEQTRESWDVGNGKVSQRCCGNEVAFSFTFSQSLFDPNIVDIINSFGLHIPQNIPIRIDDNLQTATF